jgi:hypothetical protein
MFHGGGHVGVAAPIEGPGLLFPCVKVLGANTHGEFVPEPMGPSECILGVPGSIHADIAGAADRKRKALSIVASRLGAEVPLCLPEPELWVLGRH